MKPISLAVVGLAFAALGCPPRDYEGLTNENLPMDKVVIVERAALAADRPDTTIIFERAEPASDQTVNASPANEPRDPRDEAGSSVESRPPVTTVQPADPNTPWPANSSGESQQTPGTTGAPEADK